MSLSRKKASEKFSKDVCSTLEYLNMSGVKFVTRNEKGRYSSKGCDNVEFMIYKFRTMRIDTPNVATHLLKNPEQYITPIGKFMRKTSLDELPQLFNILKGEMSVVGPRPALYNQYDLIEMRTNANVHTVRPGLTGLAQVSGRDELENEQKVYFDQQYVQKQSFSFDLKLIFLTVVKVFKS